MNSLVSLENFAYVEQILCMNVLLVVWNHSIDKYRLPHNYFPSLKIKNHLRVTYTIIGQKGHKFGE